MPEEAVLKIGGVTYGGWTSIRVSRSLAMVAGTFELGLTEKYPGAQQKYQFRLGESCTVLLGGRTVITGYVDTIRPSYSKDAHAITVAGRDKTADLADCSHVGPPAQWKNQTLLQIAQAVCRPFGINAAFEAPVGLPFDDVRTGEGDKVLPFLVKLARQREVLPISYGDGRLVFTRAGASRAGGGAIELGGNALSGEGEFSNVERHSLYVVKGQGSALPSAGLTAEQREEYLKTYVSPSGRATDAAVSRYRPLVILAEAKGDPGSFEARARWEATVRAGQSRKLVYALQGWGPESGGLWQINALARVKDDFLGANGQYLIEGVTYSKSEDAGTTSQVALVHPDAFKARPTQDAAKSITGIFDDEY